MTKLIFYEQKRVDNGLRIGIEINGTLAFHRFEEGTGESDPALRWFVDLRCEGSRLPVRPEEARQWFLQQAGLIRESLLSLADRWRAGIEPDILPLTWVIPGTPRGVKMAIVCSALRRVDGLEMSSVLKSLAQNWEKIIDSLEVYEAVST